MKFGSMALMLGSNYFATQHANNNAQAPGFYLRDNTKPPSITNDYRALGAIALVVAPEVIDMSAKTAEACQAVGMGSGMSYLNSYQALEKAKQIAGQVQQQQLSQGPGQNVSQPLGNMFATAKA